MEVKADFKNLKITPKKLRLLLPEIKKLTPIQSLDYLYYSPKKGAKIFYKAIKSAINNAKNNFKISDDLLKFKVLTVNEGQKLKRFKPGGRGTVKPFKKRFSHIKIVLTAEEKKEIKQPDTTKKAVDKKLKVKR